MTPHTTTSERGYGFKATPQLVRQYARVKGTVFHRCEHCGGKSPHANYCSPECYSAGEGRQP